MWSHPLIKKLYIRESMILKVKDVIIGVKWTFAQAVITNNS